MDVHAALEYCQSRGVSHLDVKPENIFCTQKGFVLGDFGLSAIHAPNKSEIYTGYRGTPMYMSPEVSACKKNNLTNVQIVGELADVWGLGVCCFAMLAGHGPFHSNSDDMLFRLVECCKSESFWSAHETYQGRVFASSSAKDFINKCLVVDPANRATLAELADHPWLVGARLSPDELATYLVMGNTSTTPRSMLLSTSSTVLSATPPRKRKLNLHIDSGAKDVEKKVMRVGDADDC